MAKFRKKPVVIEAWYWAFMPGGQSPPSWVNDALSKWPDAGGIAFWPDGNHGNDGSIWADKPHIAIKTLEGEMIAQPGDWIIRGVMGEIYPCKPDIFAVTYEPAE